jgi:uncharacterized protein YcbK (DUF882 family)
MEDWINVKYFKSSEFVCGCGCGLQKVDPKLVYALDATRKKAGFPMRVTSGTRCLTHNAKVGGVNSSAHTVQADGFSKAADIKINSSHQRYLFVHAAIEHFSRIIIYEEFIHVDVDAVKPQKILVLGEK